nr:hypothetical protein [Mycoplasmopsis bovis]
MKIRAHILVNLMKYYKKLGDENSPLTEASVLSNAVRIFDN